MTVAAAGFGDIARGCWLSIIRCENDPTVTSVGIGILVVGTMIFGGGWILSPIVSSNALGPCLLAWWVFWLAAIIPLSQLPGTLVRGAAWFRAWRVGTLVRRSDGMLVNLTALDADQAVGYWVACGRHDRVLAMPEEVAVPALERLLLAAGRDGGHAAVIDTLRAVGSPRARNALERGRGRIVNPVYEQITVAIHAIEAGLRR
jgi:hypothetical protein